MNIGGIPTFAILGHPNEGKSSVVSTLAEDDSVRITPYPGETVLCQSFPVLLDGKAVIGVVDTPGFQSPHATLTWLREHEGPDMLRTFVREHEHDRNFRGECELFRPLIGGAGIIYVVDASRPVRSVDKAEMEILRMTGIPRMAILNNKDETTAYLKQWRDELRKFFNSVRIFNAHRATYAERITLLESLKAIDQEWEGAITQVIDAFILDWKRRIAISAEIICDLIERCMKYTVTRTVSDATDTKQALGELEARYRQEISRIERSAHLRIKGLYKHNIFDFQMPEQSIAGHDLFHRKTWQVLGLTPLQIAAAGAAAGTTIGLGLDAATAGITFGVFTLGGALLGAGSALLGGKRVAKARIAGLRVGGFQVSGSFGGTRLEVGPNTAIQFPYVVLDRALIFYAHAINWAHGRRGLTEKSKGETPSKGYVSSLNDSQRSVSNRYFHALRRGDDGLIERTRGPMCEMIIEILSMISSGEIYPGASAEMRNTTLDEEPPAG
ncbi:MAG: GTPase/DUF3482 domain-containing protein [Desulfomonilia bacterium]